MQKVKPAFVKPNEPKEASVKNPEPAKKEASKEAPRVLEPLTIDIRDMGGVPVKSLEGIIARHAEEGYKVVQVYCNDEQYEELKDGVKDVQLVNE